MKRVSKAIAVARRVSCRDAELLVPPAVAASIAAMRRAGQLLFVLA